MTLEFQGSTYQERVALGKRIAALVLQKYGKKTLAVLIWGPGAVDNPEWKYPSLDILIVVRDGVRTVTKTYLYRGLLISIAYWKETVLLQSSREIRRNWPGWAAWYRTRFVLYERANWLRNLEEAIAANDVADATEAIRSTAWEITQGLAHLRNEDPRVIAADVIWHCLDLADEAQGLVSLHDRRYPKRLIWKESFESPSQPPSFRSFTNFVSEADPLFKEGLVKETERLCEEVLAIARACGVSFESSDLQI